MSTVLSYTGSIQTIGLLQGSIFFQHHSGIQTLHDLLLDMMSSRNVCGRSPLYLQKNNRYNFHALFSSEGSSGMGFKDSTHKTELISCSTRILSHLKKFAEALKSKSEESIFQLIQAFVGVKISRTKLNGVSDTLIEMKEKICFPKRTPDRSIF